MKVARHWIRATFDAVDSGGDKLQTAAWGWSASSVEEARQRAKASAERVAQWLISHGRAPPPAASGQYLYCEDRPPREEIVQELHDAAGEVSAILTRNSYGSVVLNSRDLMFVDVDFAPPRANPLRMLGSLFGKKMAPAPDSEEGVLDRIRTWCGRRGEYGVRLYRTAAGFRAAVIDRPMRADHDEARAILEELGSDPLYRRLCDAQQCFRARLTPKPWRMQVDVPPVRYPFADAAEQERYRVWQQTYDEAAPRFTTCRFLESHGPADVHAELAPLLSLHDSLTGSGQSLPLA